jgi:hypothetical protein
MPDDLCLSDENRHYYLTNSQIKFANDSDKNGSPRRRQKKYHTLEEIKAARSAANRKYYQKHKHAAHFRTQGTGAQEWMANPLSTTEILRREGRHMDDSRIDAFDQWWEDSAAFPWFAVQIDTEARVHQAFRCVLMAMPAEDFHRFLEASPQLCCQEGLNASTLPALRTHTPSDPGDDWPALIYFSEQLSAWSDAAMGFIVAHEAAHVVLGHYDPRRQVDRSPADATHEADANRRAEVWGFHRGHDAPERR